MKENSKYIVNRAYNKLLPPTMLSFSIASIAAITDIFFVSFYCGSFGFAVYSIFLPFSSIWGVIGEGYGTSGSSFLSKFIGGNNIKRGESFIKNINTQVVISTVIFTLICFIALLCINKDIVNLEESQFNEAKKFAFWFILSTIPFILNTYLMFIARTISLPRIASVSSLINVILNIVFDIIFMGYLNLGIMGASLALFISCMIALIYSIIGINKYSAFNIIKLGKIRLKELKESSPYLISSMIDNSTDMIILLFVNISILIVFGIEIASIIYIINFTYTVLIEIQQGLALTSAPILGTFYGEKNNKSMIITMYKGIKYCFIASGIILLFIFIFPNLIIYNLCNFEYSQIHNICTHALRIYALSVPFFFISMMLSTYMQYTNREVFSIVISLLRGLIFPIIIFSYAIWVRNIELLWWAYLLSEVIGIAVTFLYLAYKKKKDNLTSIFCLPNWKPRYKKHDSYLIKHYDLNRLNEYKSNLEVFLKANNINGSLTNKVMIIMEEIIIIANNDNRKKGYIDFNVGILYNNSIELSIKFENDFQQELLVKKSFSESNFSINNIELAMHMINSIANNVTYNRVLSMNSLILTINS